MATNHFLCIQATITPEQMAQMFWAMNDEEQAEFFAGLAAIVKPAYQADPSIGPYGDVQWYHLKKACHAHSKEAENMYMAMASFAYVIATPKPSLEE